MEKIPVQKIAKVLYVLVVAALVCNVIALVEVPLFVGAGNRIPDGMRVYSDSGLVMDGAGKNKLLTFFMGGAVFWMTGWWLFFDTYQIVLTCFLLFSGCCTAGILWQARRVLKTILRGEPFAGENAVSLRRAAVFCFLIAGAALARVLFSVCYYHSPRPLATYNALFVPMFAMGGLLCLVMSALFRQAAEIKAENDLTI
ncbi:DUF2975 domain-containing protein [Oscillibacter sp.]|uniref:DUF2975 domain-containing protein n=1 Tax=Oscillibacter sp. TaxID=1945593 RepID=UPI002D809147|nr:DUF2975 domain-containing protein [Oscillibacter sp.]